MGETKEVFASTHARPAITSSEVTVSLASTTKMMMSLERGQPLPHDVDVSKNQQFMDLLGRWCKLNS